MEYFTLTHLQTLKRNGIKVVVLMEEADQIILMPLKDPVEAERLNFLGYRQLSLSDPELMELLQKQNAPDSKAVRLSNKFKIELK